MTKHVKDPPVAPRPRRFDADAMTSEQRNFAAVIGAHLAEAKSWRRRWPEDTVDRWLAEDRRDAFP